MNQRYLNAALSAFTDWEGGTINRCVGTRMKRIVLFACAWLISVCAHTQSGPHNSIKPTERRNTTVVSNSEVHWEQLNPARGDKSPKAATLWGDRKGTGPCGYLLRPTDGFESPPHLHNVSYRGVVIRGLIHNDDPDAEHMWMPTSSYWTQPKGQVHITAAKGREILAYIEIEEGPYLVLPVEKRFRGEEVPINVDASNIVWLDPHRLTSRNDGPKIAFLWGVPNVETSQRGDDENRLARSLQG